MAGRCATNLEISSGGMERQPTSRSESAPNNPCSEATPIWRGHRASTTPPAGPTTSRTDGGPTRVQTKSISHTGSWPSDVANRRVSYSSEEHHRLFGFDPAEGMPDVGDW